jgi:hypothetical protein
VRMFAPAAVTFASFTTTVRNSLSPRNCLMPSSLTSVLNRLS